MFRSALVLLLLAGVADARGTRRAQVPNGALVGCDLCHVPGQPKTQRNAFGIDVHDTLDGQSADWSRLWNLDSDFDGFTNGEELGDPDGTWRPGAPNPGYVSHPGDPMDHPDPPAPDPDMAVPEPDAAVADPDGAPADDDMAVADPDAGPGDTPDAVGINPVNGGGGGDNGGCQGVPGALFWFPIVFARRRKTT